MYSKNALRASARVAKRGAFGLLDPVAQARLGHVKVVGDLFSAFAALANQVDGLGLELGREEPALALRHPCLLPALPAVPRTVHKARSPPGP